ncbi:MAG: hypothetical protein ACQCXQ_04930 [Verrucomicrobiales bacterium]|nr:hypothetical protein [Verrucomicrobiota bacterium JB025]
MNSQRPSGFLHAIYRWKLTTVPTAVMILLCYFIGVPAFQARQTPTAISYASTLPSAGPSSLGTPAINPAADGSMTAVEPGMPRVFHADPAQSHSPVSRERQAEVMARARAEQNYFHSNNSGAASAVAPARGLELRYTRNGMTIRPRGADAMVAPAANWSATLSTTAVGIDGSMLEAPGTASAVTISENRVSRMIARETSEWWINGESELEHGFTIATPPHPDPRALTITLAVGGNLEVARENDTIVFRNGSGRSCLNYGKLHVFDAGGRELPSSLVLQQLDTGCNVLISADLSGAAFPVTVDPVVGTQQEETLASDGLPGDEFGFASDGVGGVVAVSSPGKGSGKVYLFHENQGGAGEWDEAASVTVPAAENPVNGDRFGQSVAVFEDQATAKCYLAVGAPGHDGTGSVFVYERNQGGTDNWGFLQILQDVDLSGGDQFGTAVDGLGDTLVVGAPSHGAGAVFVFEVAGGGFSRIQKLTTPAAYSPVAGDEFGAAVAIGGDHMVIGAPGENSENGGAYLLQRGSPYAFLFRLYTDKSEPGSRFGAVVAIAVTGLLLAIGMPLDDVTFGPTLVDAGSVFIYALLATTLTWGFLGAIFGNEAGALFGSALAINYFFDLVVGARGAQSTASVVAGAVFIYLFNRLLFSYDNGSKVVPSSYIDPAMGLGASLVLLGTALFIMGPSYSGSMGAFFRFTVAATVLTYLAWQQLFWTQDQIDNHPEVTGPLADPDGDGLINLHEFAMWLIPILATPLASLGLWAADGNFHFVIQESLVSFGVILLLQYSLFLNTWYQLGAGPLAGWFAVKVLHPGIQARQLRITVSSLVVAALFIRIATQSS